MFTRVTRAPGAGRQMGIAEIVITSVLGSGVLLGAVAWLVRSLMLHLLSKDLESFKGQLQLAAFEHQVRFSQLHERRASILAELYSKVVQLHRTASSFVHWYQSANDADKKRRLKLLWQAADEYVGYFEQHRIYFDETTCAKVDSLNDALSKATSVLAVIAEEREYLAVTDEQIFDEWKKAVAVLDMDAPKLKKSLEDCFRQILGVEVAK